MVSTILILCVIWLLYKYQPDSNIRWWYGFFAVHTILIQLGWRPNIIGVLLSIVGFKVFKDIFKQD